MNESLPLSRWSVPGRLPRLARTAALTGLGGYAASWAASRCDALGLVPFVMAISTALLIPLVLLSCTLEVDTVKRSCRLVRSLGGFVEAWQVTFERLGALSLTPMILPGDHTASLCWVLSLELPGGPSLVLDRTEVRISNGGAVELDLSVPPAVKAQADSRGDVQCSRSDDPRTIGTEHSGWRRTSLDSRCAFLPSETPRGVFLLVLEARRVTGPKPARLHHGELAQTLDAATNTLRRWLKTAGLVTTAFQRSRTQRKEPRPPSASGSLGLALIDI